MDFLSPELFQKVYQYQFVFTDAVYPVSFYDKSKFTKLLSVYIDLMYGKYYLTFSIYTRIKNKE